MVRPKSAVGKSATSAKKEGVKSETAVTKAPRQKKKSNLGGVRKPHRFKAGTAARLQGARQIKNYKKYLLPKGPLIRMIRHLVDNHEMRMTDGFWRGLRHVITRQAERIIDSATRRMRLSKIRSLSPAYLLDAFDEWCGYQQGAFKDAYEEHRKFHHDETPAVPDFKRIPYGKLYLGWNNAVHKPRNLKPRV